MDTPKKRAPGAGRKKAIDKNGYREWLAELLIAYLTSQREQIVIEVPVRVHIRRGDIMLSMVEFLKVFGRPGVTLFKNWFHVIPGDPETGLSHAVITTDFDIRSSIYDWLVAKEHIDQVEKTGFVRGERAVRSWRIEPPSYYKGRKFDE